MFGHAFQTNKTIIHQKVEPSVNHQHLHTLHNGILTPHEVSPPISPSEATAVFVLCIHGRLRLEEPLDHGIAAFEGLRRTAVCCLGAAARGQATGRTQRNEGEKNSEKILGTSKVEVLEIVATQTPLWSLRILWFEMFWGHELGEKANVGSQNDLDELKNIRFKFRDTGTPQKNCPPAIGTPQSLKTILNPLDVFLCSWYMLEAEHGQTS